MRDFRYELCSNFLSLSSLPLSLSLFLPLFLSLPLSVSLCRSLCLSLSPSSLSLLGIGIVPVEVAPPAAAVPAMALPRVIAPPAAVHIAAAVPAVPVAPVAPVVPAVPAVPAVPVAAVQVPMAVPSQTLQQVVVQMNHIRNNDPNNRAEAVRLFTLMRELRRQAEAGQPPLRHGQRVGGNAAHTPCHTPSINCGINCPPHVVTIGMNAVESTAFASTSKSVDVDAPKVKPSTRPVDTGAS